MIWNLQQDANPWHRLLNREFTILFLGEDNISAGQRHGRKDNGNESQVARGCKTLVSKHTYQETPVIGNTYQTLLRQLVR